MEDWLKKRAEEQQAQETNVWSDLAYSRPLYFTTRRATYSDVFSVVTTTRPASRRARPRLTKELRKAKMPLREAQFTSPLRSAKYLQDEERQRRNEALWAENEEFMAVLKQKREQRSAHEGKAATCIASLYRMYLVQKHWDVIARRCKIRKRLRLLMHANAAGMMLDNEDLRRRRRQRWHKAAVAVQRRYRGRLGRRYVAKESVLRHAERVVHASRLIQGFARRCAGARAAQLEGDREAARKAWMAATRLQQLHRSATARRTVDNTRETRHNDCALLLQRARRRHVAKIAVKRTRERKQQDAARLAALDVQRVFRGAAARSRVARMREQRDAEQQGSAATLMQRTFRGAQGKRGFQTELRRQAHERVLVAALQLQRVGRGMVARHRVGERREERRFDIFAQARAGDGDLVDDLFNGFGTDEKHSTEEVDAGGDTVLHVAARWGHHKIVRKCLRWGFDVNRENYDGLTALQLAVAHGRSQAAEYLIAKQARFEVQGRGLLHAASASGLADVVRELLNRDADANGLDDDLRTPLHDAAAAGDADCVRQLLAAGAVADAADRDDAVPLHLAAAGGHAEAAEVLLNAGADVTLRDGAGHLAWRHALAAGHEACAKALREWWCSATGQADMAGAMAAAGGVTAEDRRAALRHAAAGERLAVEGLLDGGVPAGEADAETGNTLLHLAAGAGDAALVDVLLKRGASDTAQNARGQLPLHLGVTHDAVAARLLAEEGAADRCLLRPDGAGRTPLHVAARAGRVFPEQTARLLRTAQARAELVDEDGASVLHYAARCAVGEVRRACCASLLDAGFDAAATDARGRTALHITAMDEDGAASARLLARHARVLNAKDEGGRAALHIAAQHACTGVVRALLGRGDDDGDGEGAGADAAALDARGRSAAHHAARAGSASCLRLLGSRTTLDVRARDDEGHTLLWAALRACSPGCVGELLGCGADQMEAYPATDDTPLHVAAARGFTEGLHLLLAAGLTASAMNRRNKAGLTAAALAVRRGHAEALQVLLHNNAAADAASGTGATLLHEAAAADVPSAGVISQLVEEAGLDVEAKDAAGCRPLHVAARSQAFDAAVRVRLLAMHRADVDSACGDGTRRTALHLAAEAGASKTASVLRELGASADRQDSRGRTALDIARENGSKTIVTLLSG
eukprot:g1022.t1